MSNVKIKVFYDMQTYSEAIKERRSTSLQYVGSDSSAKYIDKVWDYFEKEKDNPLSVHKALWMVSSYAITIDEFLDIWGYLIEHQGLQPVKYRFRKGGFVTSETGMKILREPSKLKRFLNIIPFLFRHGWIVGNKITVEVVSVE